MGKFRARPVSSGNPSQIAVGIFLDSNDKPLYLLREAVPEGVAPELLHYLAEYMAKGYNTAREETEIPPLDEFIIPMRGRSIDPEVQERGQKAAKLKATGLTWGKVAMKLCP